MRDNIKKFLVMLKNPPAFAEGFFKGDASAKPA